MSFQLSIKRLLQCTLAINAAMLVRATKNVFRGYLQNGFLRDLDRLYHCAPPLENLGDIDDLVALYCRGHGLEIGPGSSPMTDPAHTKYADLYADCNSRIPIIELPDNGQLPFKSEEFDYVCSAHVLEHCWDAIRSLQEQIRVLNPGGHLLLVLPHGLRTFDAGRPLTTLDHHLADYEAGVGKYDDTDWPSFEEISIPGGNHFWINNPAARQPDGSWNKHWIIEQGYYHYHVWTQREMLMLLDWLGLEILFVKEMCSQRKDSFAIVARKPKSASV